MEIPGLYSPKAKLEVSRFFSESSSGQPAVQQLGEWRSWNGQECGRFISEVCQLPEYADVAERNLSGAYIDELLQAGLLSKGLARIGIGDFDHVRRVTAAIQKLDFGARLGMSFGASRPPTSQPSSLKQSSKNMARSTAALPRLRVSKPKLLAQIHDGYDSSWPEHKRRLSSPARSIRLPPLSKTFTVANACPVEVTLTGKPISYVFDGCHSPTVTHIRKAVLNKSASEGAIRVPYWTSGRVSPEPWGGQDEGAPNLVKTRYEWELLHPNLFATKSAYAEPEDADIANAQTRNEDLVAKMNFLNQVPLLRRLPKDQMPILASVCARRKFPAGGTIVREGTVGHEFFVMVAGTAEVLREGKSLATLGRSDYFGEKALLHDELRGATVVAKTDIECLEVGREKFRELGLHHKLHFANRKAVGAAEHRIKVKEPSPKTAEERELIMRALKSNDHLHRMVALDAPMLSRLADVAWKEEVPAGTELIKHGDMHADYFYIVQDGHFEILVPPKVQAARENAPHNLTWALHANELEHVTSIGKHGSFGEIALLYSAPRSATVKAGVNSVVWVVDRKNFKAVLKQTCMDTLREYAACLDKVQILSSLYKEEKDAVAEALTEMRFEKGQALLRKGEKVNAFYILYEGEVEVMRDGGSVETLTASPANHTTHAFGEKALLNEELQAFSVQVSSASAKILVLDREAFTYLLGSLQDIINGVHRGIHTTLDTSGDAKRTGRICRKDLRPIGLLGCGGFGKVELCEHVPTGTPYALKAVSKGFIVSEDMQTSIMNEKAILMMASNPFIINLHECYNGAQFCYFLLDAALGGELYATYKHYGLEGSVDHARFYSGSVVYAFEYLHERHIIYRDLKPENLLLTADGRVKLTDMGLAKFVLGKTYTSCGTPDYFAPEIIQSVGHTAAVDWWTLGILTYELMAGFPPFEANSPMSIYDRVLQGIVEVWFPPECEGVLGNLITELLQHEPELRLPMRLGGVQNIKTHPWFAGFDWEGLRNNTLEPPFKPEVKDHTDRSNFDDWDFQLPTQVPYFDDGSGWDRDFGTVHEPDLPESEPPDEYFDEHDFDEYDDLLFPIHD